MRNENDPIADGIGEILRICQIASIAVQVSYIQRTGRPSRGRAFGHFGML